LRVIPRSCSKNSRCGDEEEVVEIPKLQGVVVKIHDVVMKKRWLRFHRETLR
jgi:hypothetical protein